MKSIQNPTASQRAYVEYTSVERILSAAAKVQKKNKHCSWK